MIYPTTSPTVPISPIILVPTYNAYPVSVLALTLPETLIPLETLPSILILPFTFSPTYISPVTLLPTCNAYSLSLTSILPETLIPLETLPT